MPLARLLPIFLFGHLDFMFHTDDLFGNTSAAGSNAAILAYTNQALPVERVDSAYAIIFPSMTIMKIICAQIAIELLAG